MDSTVCWLTPSLCAATESHAMLLPPHCSPHTCLHGMGKGRRGHWHRAMRRHGLGCTQGGTTALAWWPDINTGSPQSQQARVWKPGLEMGLASLTYGGLCLHPCILGSNERRRAKKPRHGSTKLGAETTAQPFGVPQERMVSCTSRVPVLVTMG